MKTRENTMNVGIQHITPSIATSMLLGNNNNRTLNKNHVSNLAKEMLSGRWKVNGDTICFNGDQLIDGQHRLQAIVESGIAIDTLVVRGLEGDVFDTKDTGKRRSASDTLSVRGELNTACLAACLGTIERYVTGRMFRFIRFSNTEIEELLVKYPEARASVGATHITRRLLPRAIAAASHYLFSRKDPEEASRFMSQLISGAGLDVGDPVYVLRERLVQNTMAKGKLERDYLMAITVKAWNARREGRKVRYLRVRQEGEAQESFPLVK